MTSATSEDIGGQREQTEGGRRFCTATTRAGRVCGNPSLKDDPGGFCWAHSPTIAARRREGQKRGGSTTSARRALLLGRLAFGDLGEIKQARQALAAAVIGGQVTPPKATVVAGLLRDAEGALIQYELADRMARLENDLGLLLRGVHPAGGRQTV